MEICGETSEDPKPESGGATGYVDDVPFTSGLIQQQEPAWLTYIAALNGVAGPDPKLTFKYCDLGCGPGLTLNALASIYPDSEFVGIDFNRGHIDEAKQTSQGLGLDNVRFYHASFEDAAKLDLPEFDFVAMNGIYSWLDDELQRSVHKFLEIKLRRGGIFYVEYMTMPGMISIVPVWHLLQAIVPKDQHDSRDRAERALRLLTELSSVGLSYLDQHPPAKNAVERYVNRWAKQPGTADHFAHNAMAAGYRPRFVTEVCEELSSAGLEFVGRTATGLNDPALTVTPSQASVLRGIEDRVVRELLTDFMRSERVRRDVFVKEPIRDSDKAMNYLLCDVRTMGRGPAAGSGKEIRVGQHRIPMHGEVYDKLREGCRESALSLSESGLTGEVTAHSLVTAMHRLHATGEFVVLPRGAPCRRPETVPKQVRLTNAFNRNQIDAARDKFQGIRLVSSAVGGVACALDGLGAAFLSGWLEQGWDGAAQYALDALKRSDRTIKVNGEMRSPDELSVEELSPAFDQFCETKGKFLLAVGVIQPC
jgi:SAM-dependent methyltransferase